MTEQEEDRFHKQMVSNLMEVIKDWVAERGGATGELRLVKTCRADGQWGVELMITNPISSWNLGQ